MKTRLVLVACAVCALLLFAAPCNNGHAQTRGFVQYKIQIAPDGSAAWLVTQVQDINATVESWPSFQEQLVSLVTATADLTSREMTLDNNSLQMQTNFYSDTASKTILYQFTWLNFSIVQDGAVTFGDVFGLPDFFARLYGDGELQITYPSTYSVQSVSPQPNQNDAAEQTLDWFGTQFFMNGHPSITLVPAATSPPPKEGNGLGSQTLLYVGAGAVAAAIGVSLGVYLFRRRQTQPKPPRPAIPQTPVVETEEDKILKSLRLHGGSQFQSAITESCRFSKAKTSQLLSALEKKGLVTRYKKGRDKIVTLTEQGKGESP
jgi:uncharacterized membrane protein